MTALERVQMISMLAKELEEQIKVHNGELKPEYIGTYQDICRECTVSAIDRKITLLRDELMILKRMMG